ncbi:hypothetical protein HYPSUDRAFT_813914 [Hypholoma sublateritium FD-334 SS-4]|uniref:Uncharacterized protein n=1 Tax=Hypholoma sublateritium (strain FD-334 SS-4) TaxID=945553 RepID=A0A0D2NV98_HYPSF|nr:hypothetical protein HYPSUDRAFT_813914 [Hypholoma sublateritium FD-334 SS-4]
MSQACSSSPTATARRAVRPDAAATKASAPLRKSKHDSTASAEGAPLLSPSTGPRSPPLCEDRSVVSTEPTSVTHPYPPRRPLSMSCQTPRQAQPLP